jgi:hypothetical protein
LSIGFTERGDEGLGSPARRREAGPGCFEFEEELTQKDEILFDHTNKYAAIPLIVPKVTHSALQVTRVGPHEGLWDLRRNT